MKFDQIKLKTCNHSKRDEKSGGNETIDSYDLIMSSPEAVYEELKNAIEDDSEKAELAMLVMAAEKEKTGSCMETVLKNSLADKIIEMTTDQAFKTAQEIAEQEEI